MRGDCAAGGLGEEASPAEAGDAVCGKAGDFWPPVPRLWPGEPVAILAGGPSLPLAPVDRLRGRCRVIAVNNAFQAAPWADLLYACDVKWWERYRPDFAGLKVTQDARVLQLRDDVLRVPSERGAGLSLDPLRIRQGGNGGYQALNLAVHLSGGPVWLLGFDMKPDARGRRHWHDDHPRGLNNPDARCFADWIENYRTTVPDLQRAGVAVFNASPGSALDAFPFRDIEELL
ncbi:MAG: hypothetical protein WD270_01740 [Acetobacterales bacterium]